jgi:hypothetical protein
MGYTHYWEFRIPKRTEINSVEANYQRAIKDCSKIVKTYYQANGGLSGFTAHTPIGQYGGLKVNGKGEEGHEDFTLREYFKQNLEGDAFNFCKTAQKPYDVVVVACLIVLKARLGKHFEVSSDGYSKDWEEGLNLAQRILKVKTLRIPESIREYQGATRTQEPRFKVIKGGK